jgi:hypothetical protein
MKMLITAIFARVPNPVFCFNGIQSSRTATLVTAVLCPILRGVCNESP